MNARNLKLGLWSSEEIRGRQKVMAAVRCTQLRRSAQQLFDPRSAQQLHAARNCYLRQGLAHKHTL